MDYSVASALMRRNTPGVCRVNAYLSKNKQALLRRMSMNTMPCNVQSILGVSEKELVGLPAETRNDSSRQT